MTALCICASVSGEETGSLDARSVGFALAMRRMDLLVVRLPVCVSAPPGAAFVLEASLPYFPIYREPRSPPNPTATARLGQGNPRVAPEARRQPGRPGAAGWSHAEHPLSHRARR